MVECLVISYGIAFLNIMWSAEDAAFYTYEALRSFTLREASFVLGYSDLESHPIK